MNYLLIIIVNLILYNRTIWYGLIVDDITLYKRGPKGKWDSTKPFRSIKSIAKNRLYGACMVRNTKIDHLASLTIHIIVCMLIYRVFNNLALSLLFAVHPVTNQVSCWLNGKRYGVVTILVLLMWWVAPLGFLFYFLVPLFQLGGVTAPLLYLHTEYWYLSLIIPLFFVVWNKEILVKRRIRKKYSSPELRLVRPRKLILYFKTYGFYFCHCLFPRGIFMYHKFIYEYGLTEKDTANAYRLNYDFYRGVFLFISSCIVCYIHWGNAIGLGMFWFMIFISVWGNIVTYTQTIADRYCYLPLIGLLLALTTLLEPLHGANFILYGYFIYLASKTDTWIIMYKDLDYFYNYHLLFNQKCPFPYYLKANEMIVKHRFHSARHYCDEGLIHNPTNYKLYMVLAMTASLFKRHDKAIKYLKKAEEFLVPGKEEEQLKVIDDIRQQLNKGVKK